MLFLRETVICINFMFSVSERVLISFSNAYPVAFSWPFPLFIRLLQFSHLNFINQQKSHFSTLITIFNKMATNMQAASERSCAASELLMALFFNSVSAHCYDNFLLLRSEVLLVSWRTCQLPISRQDALYERPPRSPQGIEGDELHLVTRLINRNSSDGD